MGRTDGAPDELAAAVRADAVQDVLGALAAPGALVRADQHVWGCRVEVPVAAFAIRPQLQHVSAGSGAAGKRPVLMVTAVAATWPVERM